MFDIELAAGEAITQAGVYLVHVETGAVRRISDTGETSLPTDRRVVAIEGLAPGGWGQLPSPFGTVPRDRPLNPSRQDRAWMSPDGRNVLLSDGEAFQVIHVDSGQITSLRQPSSLVPFGAPGKEGSDEYEVAVFSSGEGFAVLGEEAGGADICRVVRYDWGATVLSDASFHCPYMSVVWPFRFLSPDGTRIATHELLEKPDTSGWGLADQYALSAVLVLDAVTGAELFRIKGASLNNWTFPWLADSSGLLVYTTKGDGIVSADGHWISLPVTRGRHGLRPSPGQPLRFLWNTTVLDDHGRVLSSVDIDRQQMLGASSDGNIIAASSDWGWSSSEVFVTVWVQGPTDFFGPFFGSRPIGARGPWNVLPPVLERSPFEERLLLRVATDGECLRVHGAPQATSPSVACLAAESVVDAVAFQEGAYTTTVNGGPWLRVRTEDGTEGWGLSDHLRWATGEPAPEAAS